MLPQQPLHATLIKKNNHHTNYHKPTSPTTTNSHKTVATHTTHPHRHQNQSPPQNHLKPKTIETEK